MLFVFAAQLVNVLVNAFQRIEFLQQIRRFFRTNAAYTRDIIGAIAHKPQIINKLARPHTVAIIHRLRIVDAKRRRATNGCKHAYSIVDQLIRVLIARKQLRCHIQLRCFMRNAA